MEIKVADATPETIQAMRNQYEQIGQFTLHSQMPGWGEINGTRCH